ncbi:MAG TPA: sodium:solute symporter family protein [Candidatus Limnocylindrales bacterium]|nr:sodium:solute symporter family protein [Candidatus Limnocylindrales bacterium]
MKEFSYTRFSVILIVGMLLTVLVLTLAETAGIVAYRGVGLVFFFGTVLLYAALGYMTGTRKVADYFVAGRTVPSFFNGMAGASNWMSAASVIGMAGTIYLLGFDGAAFLLGWTGGYVLLALLVAPYIRKLKAYTVPDFLDARYGGRYARLVGVVCAVAMNFVYLIPQFMGVGMIAGRFLGLSYATGVWISLVVVLFCVYFGGMRGITWTQVAQYLVLIIAFLIPLFGISFMLTRNPVPWLSWTESMGRVLAFEAAHGMTPIIQPFARMSMPNMLGLIFCLMVGTIGLPHVLTRFYTVPSVRASRTSVAWCLFFIVLLYISASAKAIFVRDTVYHQIVGSSFEQLPQWMHDWGPEGLDLVRFTDDNGDGILQFAELWMHADMIVISTPEIAGMPAAVSGMIGAGGMAAAISTSLGLLLVLATAVSHDVYKKMLRPGATEAQVIFWSRVIIVGVTAVSALAALGRPAIIVEMVAWAFSIAAATFFPAVVLGLWWRRANAPGALSGMIVGLIVTLAYILMARFFNVTTGAFQWVGPAPAAADAFRIWGFIPITAGVFGVPANIIVTYVVSMLTKPPSQEIQDLVTELHFPRATMVLGEDQ